MSEPGGMYDFSDYPEEGYEAGSVDFEVDSLDVEGGILPSLEELVEIIGFDFYHPDMTSTNFELYDGAITDFRMHVVQLKVRCKKDGQDSSISMEDVELLLDDRGLRPANLEEYFLFCINYPNVSIKYNIGVILGTEITYDVGGEERTMIPIIQLLEHAKTINLADKNSPASEENIFFAISKDID